MGEAAQDRRLFLASAGAALCLHAWLLFADAGLAGGADLVPHLRLIGQMGETPGLRSVYAPAFHVAGALLVPLLGVPLAVKVVGGLSAAALIAGFRSFQRAAGLPSAAAALFPWTPYLFALSWCLPKVEAAGYALAFFGLACLLRERRAAAGVCFATTFFVHTAAGLVFGVCGAVLALVRRDARALGALAGGALAASPLLAAHLAAGCTLREALLFSPGDYLRAAGRWSDPAADVRTAILAGPIGVGAALLGAPRLWREHRAAAALAATIVALCLNELWLSPFGIATTLTPMRSLSLLAFAVAMAAGVFAAAHRGLAPALVAACAVSAVAATFLAVPGSCHREPVDAARVAATDVDRCAFRWRKAAKLPRSEAQPSEAPAGRSSPAGSPRGSLRSAELRRRRQRQFPALEEGSQDHVEATPPARSRHKSMERNIEATTSATP